MSDELPAISGVQLMRLLEKDGWRRKRPATHGILFVKAASPHPRCTIIPNRTKPLPKGTLAAILAEKQTGIGRVGLLALIKTHGL